MASLKELRNKISSIVSTRKVTSAMKLVAGVKLRKAEQKALATREYADELCRIISQLRREFVDFESELFNGRAQVDTVLLLVFSSDRGLCGNFNHMINKEAANTIENFHEKKQKIRLMCIGEKLFEPLKKYLNDDDSIELLAGFYKNGDLFNNSKNLAEKIISEFCKNLIDKVCVLSTRYYSAMNRHIEIKNLIPAECNPTPDKSMTVFEPSADEVINAILPYDLTVQLYQCVLESLACEHSSRMTSMDSATRNADDLISDFSIKYNRTRQYKITQELMEVISGADAIAKG